MNRNEAHCKGFPWTELGVIHTKLPDRPTGSCSGTDIDMTT